MSRQQFVIDTRQLERLSSELAIFRTEIRQAIKSSLITSVRKSLVNAAAKHYAIDPTTMNKTFRVRHSQHSGAEGEFTDFEVVGRLLTLEHFSYSPQEHGTPRPIIEVIRGQKREAAEQIGEDGKIKTPFVINASRKSGGGRIKNIFVPLGRPSQQNPKREALKSYRTVSVPQMMGSPSVADEIQDELLQVFDANLFKRIERRTGVMQQNISKG